MVDVRCGRAQSPPDDLARAAIFDAEHGGTSKITEFDENPRGEQGQPLTAPEVNPETIRFCKIRAKAMSGAETRTEAAMIWPIGFS